MVTVQWRDASGRDRTSLEWDVVVRLDEAFPGEFEVMDQYLKCSRCGLNSQSRPANELWVVKIHHDRQPLGNLQLYCADHLRERGQESSAGSSERSSGRTGAVCPNCNVTVPLTGVCDTCDWSAK